jgi:uncharacterized protein involved in exopolysaccharide biosynthesis
LNSLEIAQTREPASGTPAVTLHDMLPEEAPISLLAVLNIMLRHRRLLLLTGVLVAGLLDLQPLLTSRTYTSDASFMPQQDNPSKVEGLATQIGIALPTATDGTQLYADLLRSRGVLKAVAEMPFTFATPEGTRTSSLVELYGKGATSQERGASAVTKLNSLVATTVSPKTSVITLRVSAPYPELARDVTVRLIDELNRFNLERRQSQAGAERKFAETRLSEAQSELRQAENELESFYAQNREYRSSPHLAFQADRLTRDVSLRQQVFTVISQTYEQSKMDEVRDTPVITIIDKPEIPLTADSRALFRTTAVGFLLGVGLAMMLAFMKDYFKRQGRSESDELSELAELRKEIRYDFRHAWSVVSHIFRRQKVA